MFRSSSLQQKEKKRKRIEKIICRTTYKVEGIIIIKYVQFFFFFSIQFVTTTFVLNSTKQKEAKITFFFSFN